MPPLVGSSMAIVAGALRWQNAGEGSEARETLKELSDTDLDRAIALLVATAEEASKIRNARQAKAAVYA